MPDVDGGLLSVPEVTYLRNGYLAFQNRDYPTFISIPLSGDGFAVTETCTLSVSVDLMMNSRIEDPQTCAEIGWCPPVGMSVPKIEWAHPTTGRHMSMPMTGSDNRAAMTALGSNLTDGMWSQTLLLNAGTHLRFPIEFQSTAGVVATVWGWTSVLKLASITDF